MKNISVTVPATLTNLGSGFDALGLAVSVCNKLTAQPVKHGLAIEILGEGENFLPRNSRNLAYRAMDAVFRRVKRRPKGIILRLENNIPIGRGMGSSAACIVGGLLLANTLIKGGLSQEEIFSMATAFEGHPDNVIPALVGGFTVAVADKTKVRYSRHILHRSIYAVLAVPDGQILTHQARKVLPKSVPLADAVFNLSRSALTVSALTTANLDLLNASMQDRLHESYRRKLFPKLTQFLEVLRRAGGKGASVSGSGPTVVTFAEGNKSAYQTAARIRADLRRSKLKAGVWVVQPAKEGARVSIKK